MQVFVFSCVGLTHRHRRRLNDIARQALVGDKGAAALDILALVVALFGFCAQVAAGAGVGRFLADRAMHHGEFPLCVVCRGNNTPLTCKCKLKVSFSCPHSHHRAFHRVLSPDPAE